MPVPLTYTTTLLTDDANGIAESQSPGTSALTINGALASGGIATMAEAQIIRVTSGGNDSGITFAIVGTDADGYAASETLTGTNASNADTTGHFATVSSITPSAAIAGTVVAGVVQSLGAATRTFRINRNQPNFKLGLYVVLSTSPTLDYTVQYSMDYPEDGTFLTASARYSNNANWRSVDGLTALTVSDESNINFPMECVRLLINSNTVGTATFTCQQGF